MYPYVCRETLGFTTGDWRAEQAISSGSVSVINLSNWLYHCYSFLLEQFRAKCDEPGQELIPSDDQDTFLRSLVIDGTGCSVAGEVFPPGCDMESAL